MTITLDNSQLSNLAASAKQAASKAASSSSSASTSTSASSTDTSSAALSSLASNYNQFLTLLTAQLQNQDPTSPMDTSQFTTELVQFTGVQQQVQTNSNLTQLIQLSQDQEMSQSSSLVGKQATITGSTVPLQNGTAKVSFTTSIAEPVSISVTNSSEQDVKDVQFSSTTGSNTWTWDGTDNNGNQLADGAYTVAVEGADQTGTASPITFTSVGTPTGVTQSSSGLSVSFGSTSLPYSDIQSVQ